MFIKTVDRRMFVYVHHIIYKDTATGFRNTVYDACMVGSCCVYTDHVRYTFYAVRTQTKGIFEFPVCSTQTRSRTTSVVLPFGRFLKMVFIDL